MATVKLPPESRARRILARLDERLEDQLFPTTTARGLARSTILVDRFHTRAGFIERRVLPFAEEIGASELAQHLRRLKLIVAEHREAFS